MVVWVPSINEHSWKPEHSLEYLWSIELKKKQNRKTLVTQYTTEYRYPCDRIPDRQLWLPAAAQHHERISSHISLAWGKNENSKFEIWFLLNAHHFCTIIKLKNHNLNHCKSRTLCISKFLAPTAISFIPRRGTTPLLQQENLFQQELSHLSFLHPALSISAPILPPGLNYNFSLFCISRLRWN